MVSAVNFFAALFFRDVDSFRGGEKYATCIVDFGGE
jgi:hypothetical protein